MIDRKIIKLTGGDETILWSSSLSWKAVVDVILTVPGFCQKINVRGIYEKQNPVEHAANVRRHNVHQAWGSSPRNWNPPSKNEYESLRLRCQGADSSLILSTKQKGLFQGQSRH